MSPHLDEELQLRETERDGSYDERLRETRDTSLIPRPEQIPDALREALAVVAPVA
ncbi:hypothetical protein [Streptomyces sp. 2A115]|uniref:hypothetical protein n=1 Tax=Streptomyces sp. 2A115 TaxID=3457439 RepID=UPI003FD047C1